MKAVVPQGSQKEFPRTLMGETSMKERKTRVKEIFRLRQLMMESSPEEMRASITTAMPAEDPCEGDQTSIDEFSNLSERKKHGRVSVRTCTPALIAATGPRLPLNPEPFYQPAYGWLTLQDLAQRGRLMMELTR